ncbi:MAG: acyl-CoA dehydrogenase family protein [Paracoccaceae bacterium]
MSDNARMLEDLAERLFGQAMADPAARKDAELPTRLAAMAEEAGLPLALIPEEEGGMGATLEDAAVLAWRAGYHAAPLPIVSLILAPTLAGADGAVLAAPGTRQAEGPADRIAVVAGDTLAIHAAEPAFEALDHRPWVRATGDALATYTTPGLADRLAVQGACLTAAAMLGAMHRVSEITIDYANTRKQFGRPLSAFQALQHRIAEAVSEYTVAQAAVAGAIRAFDGGWLRPLHWQSAKVQSGRAATTITAAAHQILGAIGFTEEHELHHYSKRLWIWRDSWGRQAALEDAIGQAAIDAPEGLWSHIVDSKGETA